MAHRNNVNNTLKRRGERPKTGQEMALLLKRKLKTIFEEYKVDFSYLGGSWVNNAMNWWSDIDIFISVPSFFELSSNAQLNFLTQLHVRTTNLTKYEEIEISVLENLPLHIQFRVISDGILLYEKNTDICSCYIEKLLPFYYDHMIWYNKLLDQSEYI